MQAGFAAYKNPLNEKTRTNIKKQVANQVHKFWKTQVGFEFSQRNNTQSIHKTSDCYFHLHYNEYYNLNVVSVTHLA